MPEPLTCNDIYASAIKQLHSYTNTHNALHKESIKALLAKMQKPQQNPLPILIVELQAIPLDARLQNIIETIIDSLLDAKLTEDVLLSLVHAIRALNPEDKGPALLRTSRTRDGSNAFMLAVYSSSNTVADFLEIINTLNAEEKAKVFLQTTRNPLGNLNGLNALMLAAWRSPRYVVPFLTTIKTLPIEQQKNILTQTNNNGEDALALSRDNTEAYYPLQQLYREHRLLHQVTIGKHRKNKGASSSGSTDFFHDIKRNPVTQGESSASAQLAHKTPRAGS